MRRSIVTSSALVTRAWGIEAIPIYALHNGPRGHIARRVAGRIILAHVGETDLANILQCQRVSASVSSRISSEDASFSGVKAMAMVVTAPSNTIARATLPVVNN